MPIRAQWIPFVEGMPRFDRDEPGVYELGNTLGAVVYIGSADQLKRRVNEHLAESGTCIKRNASLYRVEYTHDHVSRARQLLDEHVKANGVPPVCNDGP